VGGVAGQAGFQTTYDAKSFIQDTDNNAATTNLLFGQVPVGTANQGLFYDVGQPANPSIKNSGDVANGQPAITGLASTVSWNLDDSLGDLADANQGNNNGAFQRGVLIAQGRFNAGSTPAFAAGTSEANVFTALGSAAAAPSVGTIQLAAVTTQVRTNIGVKRADANLDGDVDVFQLDGKGDAQLVSSNVGKTDQLWQNGDFNGDKDVDVFQLDGKGDAQILSSSIGAAVAADAPAGTAAATYFAATGKVVLDIGSGIAVVGFGTSGGTNLANDSLLQGTPPLQKDADVVAWFNIAGLPVGISDVGNALKPGLTQAQIGFSYTPIGLDTVTVPVTVVPVPEPATLAIMGLAGVLAASMRKRIAA
jgi:hypothetical protein